MVWGWFDRCDKWQDIFFSLIVRYLKWIGFEIENNPWIRIYMSFHNFYIPTWQYWFWKNSYFSHEYDHRCNNETLRKLLGVICNLPFLQKKTAWKGWPQNVKAWNFDNIDLKRKFFFGRIIYFNLPPQAYTSCMIVDCTFVIYVMFTAWTWILG